MKKLLIILASLTVLGTNVQAAQFKSLKYNQVSSKYLQSAAVKLKKLHTAIQDDQGFYQQQFRSAVFKIKPTKGQSFYSMTRQLTRYVSFWKANKLSVDLDQEVRFTSFIDGLFPQFGDEDMSEAVYAAVNNYHSGIARMVAHRNFVYAEFSYAAPTQSRQTTYGQGWFVFDKTTSEVLVSLIGERG